MMEFKVIISLIKKYGKEMKGDGVFRSPKKLKNKEVEVSYLGGGDPFTDPCYYGDYLIKKGGDYYLLVIGSETAVYVYNIKLKEVVGDPIYYKGCWVSALLFLS